MISTQDAEKKLEAQRRELAGLEKEKESLSEKLQALEDKRARAVRDLAAGRGKERTVEALDAQMRPSRFK